jgi:uncharacterized 2Fe-2S/4Fe-4S cluster protein (DUF4445 family)
VAARVPVTFVPAGITVWVEPGATVIDAAKRADVVVPAPCGGRGVCGTCGVRVVSGTLSEPDAQERAGLRYAPGDVRLACRARIEGPCEIRPILAQPSVSRVNTGGALTPLVAGVDLGTTSVAAVLVDAATGREVARASVPNRQQAYGADVLTRMSAALAGSSADLMGAAELSIASAIHAAASLGGVETAGIERLVVAANSAMIGLLSGSDMTSLATSPFTPTAKGGELPPDSALRMGLTPSAVALVLPPMAGFVGGDALAATLAAGMADADEPTLLVDLGTNAEIVLAGCGPLIVASAAAGPAFEGAGVSCGGPAAEGAVTKVTIGREGSVDLTVIGSEPPRWFSGSGVVSAVAELLRVGHLRADGLLTAKGPLEDRFTLLDGVVTVSLGSVGECLTVNQLDVRSLQLAKAAVRTGIEAVLRASGVGTGALREVLVAGAFGSALDSADLVDLGVFPRDTATKIRSVGNAALEGAAVIALDPALLDLAVRVACGARHVDLAGDPGFTSALMEATELKAFTIGT